VLLYERTIASYIVSPKLATTKRTREIHVKPIDNSLFSRMDSPMTSYYYTPRRKSFLDVSGSVTGSSRNIYMDNPSPSKQNMTPGYLPSYLLGGGAGGGGTPKMTYYIDSYQQSPRTSYEIQGGGYSR
jgi:hypothetical protein